MGQNMCPVGWPLHSHTGQQEQRVQWDPCSVRLLPSSLKEATRERRQGGKPPTTYHVQASTPLGKLRSPRIWQSKPWVDMTLQARDMAVFVLGAVVLWHFTIKCCNFTKSNRKKRRHVFLSLKEPQELKNNCFQNHDQQNLWHRLPY